MKRHGLSAVLAALATLACSGAQAQWTIVELGQGQAVDINVHGVVVGQNSALVAWEYKDGQAVVLGLPPDASSSFAARINSHGTAVGTADYPPDLGLFSKSVQFKDGQITLLPDLPGFTAGSWAAGINNRGHVVGCATATAAPDSAPLVAAYLYANGSMSNLGDLPGHNWTCAHDINGAAQVVGQSCAVTGYEYAACSAFLYSNGQMIDLGIPSGSIASSASQINRRGHITGYVTPPDYCYQPFVYANGQMTNIGHLPGADCSTAFGLNDFDQVTGIAMHLGPDSWQKGYLYHHGVFTDLAALPDVVAAGWTSLSPSGINNRGQIVGTGVHSGQLRQFLLSPVQQPATTDAD